MRSATLVPVAASGCRRFGLPRLATALCWLVLVAWLSACNAGEDINGACPGNADSTLVSVEIGVEGLQLLSEPHLIVEGNSVHLRAVPFWRDACSGDTWAGTDASVAWTSSAPALATVYPNGIVHTHATGSATVTATVVGANATLRLEIIPAVAVPAVAALVTGGGPSCALAVDGGLYCWGDGVPSLCVRGVGGSECGSDYTAGPLSAGEYPWSWATCSYGSPQVWSDPGAYVSDFPCSRVPSRYTLGVTLSTVDAGRGAFVQSHGAVCGFTDDGALYCAGTVGPVRQVGSGTVDTDVAVGSHHACALDRSGAAHCWGANDYGELGDSTRQARDAVQPVYGDRRFRTLGAAFHFTCGLGTDGRAYCWGASLTGQVGGWESLDACGVGYLAIPCSLIPRPVSDTVFVELTVGGTNLSDTHACGLTAEGTAYCWGGDYDGSLGHGETGWRAEPTAVAGGLRFESVSAGGSHTCGIALDGSTYCWGSNMWGQLGHPGVAATSVPVPVLSETPFTAVSAGGSHTCGLTAAGAVYCWGYNEGGQLGNGLLDHSNTPVRIAGQ